MCESIPAASTTPRANPGHLKTLVKCPALRVVLLANAPPPPRSYYDGQMTEPQTIRPINKTIFNIHICFSSIELVTE